MEPDGFSALLALRRLVSSNNETPQEKENSEYELDGIRFPSNTETPLVSSGKHMTLKALVVAVETAKETIGHYIKAAISQKVDRLFHSDRSNVIDFLTGKTDWIDQIKAARPVDQDPTKGVEPADTDASIGKKKIIERGGATASNEEEEIKRRKARNALSPEEALLRKIRKREGCHRTRDSVLESSHRFTEALKIERDVHRKAAKSKADGITKANGNQQEKKVDPLVAAGGLPIIVVPATLSAPITLYNIKAFLEEGRYISTAEARALNPVIKNQTVYVERKSSDNFFLRFKVVDSVKRFQDSHWRRIAAVFTSGPRWQFKNWKWKDTATIFDKCRGLHVYFDDKKLEDHIKAWNVLKFPLSKQTRSSDSTQAYKVWQSMESFLEARKPELLTAGARAADMDIT